MEASPAKAARPSYRWPWFVLAAVILAILLAIVWMSYAVKRTRMIRDLNSPTNSVLP